MSVHMSSSNDNVGVVTVELAGTAKPPRRALSPKGLPTMVADFTHAFHKHNGPYTPWLQACCTPYTNQLHCTTCTRR